MSWLRRMFDPARRNFKLPPDESTRTELEWEKARREQEHRRTQRLAQMIADYQKQDHVLGRR